MTGKARRRRRPAFLRRAGATTLRWRCCGVPRSATRRSPAVPRSRPRTRTLVVAEQVEIQAKYHGYIERQREQIARQRSQDATLIPDALDYSRVRGLSAEVREKLARQRPETIGQAGRISGITPAALSLLLVYLRRSGGGSRAPLRRRRA